MNLAFALNTYNQTKVAEECGGGVCSAFIPDDLATQNHATTVYRGSALLHEASG